MSARNAERFEEPQSLELSESSVGSAADFYLHSSSLSFLSDRTYLLSDVDSISVAKVDSDDFHKKSAEAEEDLETSEGGGQGNVVDKIMAIDKTDGWRNFDENREPEKAKHESKTELKSKLELESVFESSLVTESDLESKWDSDEELEMEEDMRNAMKTKKWNLTRDELLLQLRLAFPICSMGVLTFLISMISAMFVGHLGKLELASSSIATSLASVTGYSTMLGLSGAMETLCGQAYGAKKYTDLGVYMQQGFFVLTCFSIPIALIWVYLGSILRMLGQDPAISDMAGIYAFWLLPSLFAFAWTQPIVKFMQSQGVVTPLAITPFITFLLIFPANYLFIYFFDLGFRGAALAISFGYWVNLIGLLVFLRFSPQFKNTWGGWSFRAFENLGVFMQLAGSSWSMLCLESWSFQGVIIIGGLLPHPELEVSALSICLSTAALLYYVPSGLSAAASTRVANEIGAGHWRAARRSAYVAFSLSCIIGTTSATFIFFVRNFWGFLFSSNLEVVNYLASIFRVQIFVVFLDAINAVISGIVRGVGKQMFATISNFVSFYLIGLPLGYFLAFFGDFGAKGLWIGITMGLFGQSICFLSLLFRTNWEDEVLRISFVGQEMDIKHKDDNNSNEEEFEPLKMEEGERNKQNKRDEKDDYFL